MSFTAYLVDDDPGVLKALSRLLHAAGYESRSYACANDFLLEHDPSLPGCVILDVNMPELDGIELQRRLTEGHAGRQIIFLSGMADVPTSVAAMKAGAIDFLVKPVKRDRLLGALVQAEERDTRTRAAQCQRQSVEAKLASLTPREREVLGHVVLGRLNKQIAADLGTVEKTIKVHRGRMMAKLGVRSVADLVRLVSLAEVKAHD
jgi:FixJ family two-component response regulator